MSTLEQEQREAAEAIKKMCTTAEADRWLLVYIGEKIAAESGRAPKFGFFASLICLLERGENGSLCFADIGKREQLFTVSADGAAPSPSIAIALFFTEGSAAAQMQDLLQNKLALLNFSEVFDHDPSKKGRGSANAFQMNKPLRYGLKLSDFGVAGADKCRCIVWINHSQEMTEGYLSEEKERYVTITPLSEHSLSTGMDLLQVIPGEQDATNAGLHTKYFLRASDDGVLTGPYVLEDGEPKEATEGPLPFGDHVRRDGAQDLIVGWAGTEGLTFVLSQELVSDPDIDELVRRVRAQRPSMSEVDVINYFICLTQGYITTFAGLPGTGKSSLCRILGRAMGLHFVGEGEDSGGTIDAGRGNFVDISVERGWSSYRDYIGYWNPLINRVERTNPEVWEALCSAGGHSTHPYVFMLDEANLSPLEHYWSPFLRVCDDFACQECSEDTPRPSRDINIGAPSTAPEGDRAREVADAERLKMSRNTRFLATVNTDWTTEELSPRFLDRSWVIKLDAPKDPIELDAPKEQSGSDSSKESSGLAESEQSSSPKCTGSLSYDGLLRLFGARSVVNCHLSEDKTEEGIEKKKELLFKRQKPFDGQETLAIDADVIALYVELLKLCQEHGHPISPRSQKMMLNYIGTATELMEGKKDSDKFTPLDFAFSQKVLPGLSGTDSSIKKLLEDLKGCSIASGVNVEGSLPRTHKLLSSMLAGGKSDGCYSLFK